MNSMQTKMIFKTHSVTEKINFNRGKIMNRNENFRTLRFVLGFMGVLFLAFIVFSASGCQSDSGGSKKTTNPFSAKEKKLNALEQEITSQYGKADKATRGGKTHEALEAYMKILAIYDENKENPDLKREVEPYCRIGMIHEGYGQYAEAEKFYRQAMDVDPKSPVPYNSLGYSYITQQRLDDAIEYLQKAVEMAPTEPKYNNNLGLAYGLKKDYDQAFLCFRRVSTEADAYYNMSGVFAMNGSEAEAKMALERAVELNPNHREAKRMLLAYDEQKQNPEDAEMAALPGNFPGASVPYRDGTSAAGGMNAAPYHRQYGSAHREIMSSGN